MMISLKFNLTYQQQSVFYTLFFTQTNNIYHITKFPTQIRTTYRAFFFPTQYLHYKNLQKHTYTNFPIHVYGHGISNKTDDTTSVTGYIMSN